MNLPRYPLDGQYNPEPQYFQPQPAQQQQQQYYQQPPPPAPTQNRQFKENVFKFLTRFNMKLFNLRKIFTQK